MGVILLWAKYFGPKPQAPPQQMNRPAQSAPAIPGTATSPAANTSQAPNPATAISPAPATSVPPKSDTQERTIVIENDLYRVEISNRGAVAKSWQLKKYMDD